MSESSEWLKIAKSNLTIGKSYHKFYGEYIRFEELCFELQQCVEKSLKALLVFYGIKFKKTHSILELIDLLLDNKIKVPDELLISVKLTDYAVETRYPDNFIEVTKDEYKEAVEIAEKVYAWAENIINKQNKKAFTLMEVMITLAVFGTLMALIIPSMVNNSTNTSYPIALRKSYSMLTEATNKIMLNNSGTLTNAFTGTGASSNAATLLSNTFEFTKTCSPAASGSCWSSTTPLGSYSDYIGTILSDGMFLAVNITSVACTDVAVTSSGGCGYALVDVNGANSPNTVGRDIFMFKFLKTGIYPAGDINDTVYSSSSCTSSALGYGCTAKLLDEGEMNY